MNKRGRPKGSKWGEYTEKFTQLGRPSTLAKIRAIAQFERLPIMVIIDRALCSAIQRYEENKGVVIDYTSAKSRMATLDNLFND